MAKQNTNLLIDEIISYLYEELSLDQKVAFERRLSSDQLLHDMVQGQRNFRDTNGISSSGEHKQKFYTFVDGVAKSGEKTRHTRRSMREN